MSWIGDLPSGLPHVLGVQARDPDLLRAHLALYRHVQFGPGSLSRAERELVAVAVSAVNECFY